MINFTLICVRIDLAICESHCCAGMLTIDVGDLQLVFTRLGFRKLTLTPRVHVIRRIDTNNTLALNGADSYDILLGSSKV